jgi:hypothetical protein
MKRSKLLAGALALLPAAGLLAVTQLADAHHPDIEAHTVCVDTSAKVTIDVTSWTETDEPARRVDGNVSVSWDGAVVGHGAFTPENSYHFTVTLSLPADGTTHVANATAVAPFGPAGEYGYEGSYREVSVTLPTTCTPTTTTAPTTTAAPTTTVAPVTTTTAPTPVQVLGESVTRPAVPVEVLPKFAG